MKPLGTLIKGSAVMFAGMAAASVASWLFTVLMGRALGPASYAELVALVALLGIIAVPAQAIQTTAAKFSSAFAAGRNTAAITHLARRFSYWFTIFSLAGFLLYVLFSGLIARFLNIENMLPVVLLGTTILSMFLLAINRGILQGTEQFGKLSLSIATDPTLKLALGVAAVWLGLGVAGAVGGISFGIAVAYVWSTYWIKKMLPKHSTPVPLSAAKTYSSVSLIALIVTALLFNNDVILAKHFLSAEAAGLYGALSTIGKIVFFITAPVAAVMFPLISKQVAKRQQHYPILLGGLGLVGLVGALILVVYQLVPGLVVRVIYGGAYQAITPYLGLIGLVFLLYSLIFVMVQYFLSVDNHIMIVPLGATGVLHYLAIVRYHGTFGDLAMGQMVALAVGLAALFALYAIPKLTKLIAQ
ncbi:hypothetical protein HY065_03085 [Candidatus Berkelbacteria bacterium]|nr:hypothetical protein [Candidatus Berkelbacteria bacterium]